MKRRQMRIVASCTPMSAIEVQRWTVRCSRPALPLAMRSGTVPLQHQAAIIAISSALVRRLLVVLRRLHDHCAEFSCVRPHCRRAAVERARIVWLFASKTVVRGRRSRPQNASPAARVPPSRLWMESKMVRTSYMGDHLSFRMSRQIPPDSKCTFGWNMLCFANSTAGAAYG